MFNPVGDFAHLGHGHYGELVIGIHYRILQGLG
jgi:hypothetical protein